jgi:hypothetical protein
MMKTIVLFIYLFSLLLSALMAFVHRKALKSRLLSILTPYLIYVFIQELSIYFYLREYPGASTGIFYNIYNPVSVLTFAFLYSRIPLNAPARKPIAWLVTIYLLVTAVTLLFIQPITTLSFYLSLAAGFAIASCGIFFLFNYFNLDNSAEEKHWRPVLWVTIGVVVFYPVVDISWAFHKYLLNNNVTIAGIKLYQLIPQVMSIFMYGCFAYAFYLCRKKN